jgi:predicted MPP superfamily phosphohydrolase
MNASASQIDRTLEISASAVESRPRESHLPGSRALVFATVILGILLAANWFVCFTWNQFLGPASTPLWQIIPPALSISFVATTILSMRYDNALLRMVYRAAAIWLGVLSFTFFASFACWFLHVPLTSLSPVEPRSIVVVLFGLAFLASICALVNASWIRVTRLTVTLPNLPETWRGRSAALVTDLHLGNVRGARFTRRVASKLQSLKPDAVFISGDMFDGTKVNLDRFVAPWRNLSVPHGKYFVSGNHEEFTSRARFLDAIERTGIRVLNNEKVGVDGLQIVGVHDGEAGDPQVLRAILKSTHIDSKRASILLAHQPSNVAVAAEAGISLQLCGHTHQGQIWPWNWAAALVHGRFNYGLNSVGSLQVLTSSGVGTWGPPMRLGTKSEIVLIHFENA